MESRKLLATTEKACDMLAGVMVLVVTAAVMAQVVGRHVAQAMPGVLEGIQLLLVAITFLGLAYTQSHYAHIRMEFVIDNLPPGWRRRAELVSLLLSLAVFMLITYVGGAKAYESWRMNDTSMGLIAFPLWPSKAFVPVGSALLCLRLMMQLADVWSGRQAAPTGGEASIPTGAKTPVALDL